MIASEATPISYRGEPATLRVMRNDGFCWGRLVTHDGEQFDVDAPDNEDVYDQDDAYAFGRFEEALATMNAPELVQPAAGWL